MLKLGWGEGGGWRTQAWGREIPVRLHPAPYPPVCIEFAEFLCVSVSILILIQHVIIALMCQDYERQHCTCGFCCGQLWFLWASISFHRVSSATSCFISLVVRRLIPAASPAVSKNTTASMISSICWLLCL